MNCETYALENNFTKTKMLANICIFCIFAGSLLHIQYDYVYQLASYLCDGFSTSNVANEVQSNLAGCY